MLNFTQQHLDTLFAFGSRKAGLTIGQKSAIHKAQ